jgi:toxin-antitoxin system PIN domain toxin
MILIDTNLWLYACFKELPEHPRSRAWLESVMNGDEPVALAWNVVLAVLRISTQQRLLQQPLRPSQALELVDGWFNHPVVQIVEPGPRNWSILSGLLAEAGTAGNHTNDAHLAALAIEHRCTLCSADAGFRRFTNLRVHNPLS